MLLKLLQKISEELDKAKIPYMLSGSVALNQYSIPRMTRDIDIVIELMEDNIPAFLEIFSGEYYIDADTVKEETKRRGMFNVIDHVTGYKVDFIIRKDTEYRRLEFSRRQRGRMAGFDVWIVAIEDLIISKIEWIQVFQSDRQMEDISNLLENDNIDREYIRHWCDKLNLKTFNLL